MKFKKIIFTFLAFGSVLLLSCNSENSENKNSTINKDSLNVFQQKDSMKNVENRIDTVITVIDTTKDEKEINKTKKVFKYICPLGDKDGNSDKEGICPTCEMELIENPDFIK